MLKSILRIGAVGLLAAAIIGTPAQLLAQSTNKTTTTKKTSAAKTESGSKQKAAHPFHGKLAAVDKTAKTIKLGESVYQINSTTKITKDGKPATLEDGVIGEPVSGYVKPTEDGKMVATTVNFGTKPTAKPAAKPDDKSGTTKK
jgi:hypothetical protein